MVSESPAVTSGPLVCTGARTAAREAVTADARRRLQLVLAAIWLLDGLLQYQPFMFSRGFSQMLAGVAAGNPAVIADPITWAARIVADHPAPASAAFATIQLLIGLGIACRPTVRAALAASIVWAVAVWWFGEGLGGILTGRASPVSGAPGAVIIYALLAVLLWPAPDTGYPAEPEFVAARPAGATVARVLWLVLWGSLAYFAVTAASRTAQGLHDMVAGMAGGEPGWLAAINRGAAGVLAHQGLTASIVLAVLLGLVAVGVFLPPPLRIGAVALAFVIALLIWVVGQDFGRIAAGDATDPNSGPLLALLAAAYWPAPRTGRRTPEAAADRV